MPVNRIFLVSACSAFLALPAELLSASAQERSLNLVSLERGVIVPAGPPLSPPVRVDSGDSCVIDIILPYIFDGSLQGVAEVNYRIDVKGPCAQAAPGVFDETWIARGIFTGSPGDASFVYTADVKAGGKIKGEIVLGQGLNGRLWVSGNLTGTQLDYRGFVDYP